MNQNYSQQQLCALYELLYGHRPFGSVSFESISDILNLFCTSRKDDIEYSIDIINTTDKPDLFYEYVRFLREKLSDLEQVEHIAPDLFSGDYPSVMLARVNEQVPKVEVDMWERAYISHTDTHGKKQSEKVRKTRIDRYFEKVDKYLFQASDVTRDLFAHQRKEQNRE